MTHQEVIKQLEDLIADRESLLEYDPYEPDNIFLKDIQALKEAIRIIKEAKEMA